MKNVLFKNSIKQIKNTHRRFVSILVMALLGVGFFAGLYATGPDMKESLDKYLDETDMYDISIVSTLGLTDEDIDQIKNVDGLEIAYGIKEKDAEVTIADKEFVMNFIDYNEKVNRPVIVEGRMPENNSECIIDQRFYNTGTCKVGDTLTIKDDDEKFNNDKLTIVGIMQSPLYISSDKGTTTLGAGSINCISYVFDNINTDYYSSIAVNVKGAKSIQTDTKQYDELINTAKENINTIKEERQNARYNQLIEEATDKLNDAKKEFEDEKNKGEDKISKAEKQIEDGKKELEKAKQEIENSKNQLNNSKEEAKSKFDNARKEINKNKEKILESKEQLQKYKKEYNAKEQEAQSGIKELENNISNLEKQKENLQNIGADTTQIDKTIGQLKKQKLETEKQLTDAKNEIEKSEKELQQAENKIKESENKLKAEQNKADKKIKQAQNKISNAEKTISSNEKKLKESEEKLEKSKKEFDDKVSDAQNKLDDSQKEIDKIKVAKWYVLGRKDNTGYNNVTQAVTSIVNLSKIFPILFYVIAVLISLTSMTRMVEEERIEIGTLKALGYTNLKIVFKYIIYSMLACIIGGTIGMFIGLKLIPNIIWIMYSLLYYLPSFDAKLKVGYGILGIVIAFICIGGATFVVSYKELKNMPAVLMRPKAPKNGKRVILEKITFLWNRLSFSKKVTIRNLFRYKKRVLMTIIGISGCTALILAGFGLKDSITDIVHNQFERVNTYDISVTVNTDENEETLLEKLKKDDRITESVEVNMQTGKLSSNNIKRDVKINVPKNKDDIIKVVNLIDKKTKNKVELSENGIIITDKVAEILNVKKGDIVTLTDNNDIEYNLKVDGIVENYVDHYVYMSKELYEKEMKEKYKTNMILVNTNNLSDEESEELTKQIVAYKEVSGINLVSSLITMVENMLSLLDYIVIILIVSAALLAFVVLYNLANVNISERKREIATLKVLGFYDKEVDNYINKESIILTILGIALGLVLGFILTKYLITTCEIEMLRFGRKISFISYIYSIIITSIFTFLVNKIIHFSLKKIDMIDSLKSIE